MKILMAIDGAKSSADVLRALVMQFQPANTEVLVLHVVQPLTVAALPQMSPGYAPELESQEGEAHELVGRVAKELQSAGFKVETAVELGDVREQIIDCAEANHSDLIMLGAHGRSGIQRFLMGNVAEFVARHAKCSVQVVRAPR